MTGDMQCGGVLHTDLGGGDIPVGSCKGNSHLPGCKGVIKTMPFAGTIPMPCFGISHTD